MLRQLKTFIAIADSGSFHRAAQKMCITESAVSMQMKNLEDRLILELFDRSVRPPQINNTGRLLLDRMREIVTLSDQLRESSPVASQFKGTIRIGSIPGASFILPDTLYRLSNTYRQLQVRVFTNLTDALVKQVARDRLDAVLVTEPAKLEPQLLIRPILSEPLLVLAPRSQAGKSDRELLEENRYISFNRKAEVSRLIEESMRQRRIKVNPSMEIDTLETFQMMIVRGLGVGILPMSSIREHFMDDFYTVPFGSPILHRKISLIQLRDHHQQNFIDALYDALIDVAKTHHVDRHQPNSPGKHKKRKTAQK